MTPREAKDRISESKMTPREAKDRISEGLKRIGVREGGVLLVHSSLSSLGWVPGGPETVILGLLDALGDEGTLLMPALSYAHVTPDQPRFDVRKTPSNVGAIPEHFRRRPGTRRSLHPTHSVCGVGPRAEEILAGHALDRTPCGPHSPFRQVRDLEGQILFLGCGLRPNTSMHGVEELVEPPYLFGKRVRYELVREDGRIVEGKYRQHGFEGWRQRYDRIAALLGAEDLRTGRLLEATVHLLEAGPMWAQGEKALREDPLFFVERRD